MKKRNYGDIHNLTGAHASKPYKAKRVKKGPKSNERDDINPVLERVLPQNAKYVAKRAPVSYVRRVLGQDARRINGLFIAKPPAKAKAVAPNKR